MASEHTWTADGIAHDLDMLVFELEQAPKEGADAIEERARLRRKLEKLRDRVQDLRDALK